MPTKKVITKTDKRPKPAPVKPVEKIVIDEEIVLEPVLSPQKRQAKLEAMLRELKLNDAKTRLERATAAQNPDAMIACMDEIRKLEEEGKV